MIKDESDDAERAGEYQTRDRSDHGDAKIDAR
jgi:hypothetical protein